MPSPAPAPNQRPACAPLIEEEPRERTSPRKAPAARLGAAQAPGEPWLHPGSGRPDPGMRTLPGTTQTDDLGHAAATDTRTDYVIHALTCRHSRAQAQPWLL